jgi:outer membrane protein assembly factor BamB
MNANKKAGWSDGNNAAFPPRAVSVVFRLRFPALLGGVLGCLFLASGCDAADPAAPTAPAAAAVPAAVGETDWPLFRGDPQATGVARSTLPDQPVLLWKQTFKDAAFEACAIIVNGVIYVGSAGTDGDFYALDLATGMEKWKFHTEYGLLAAAAFRDGRIYVGDQEGRCYCLNAADGKLIWKHETKAAVHGGPNYFKDKVLFNSE